ncbi:hypothetical protein [Haladaptatus halobius]|uniref:hypothetical protein n=1 Tax=Haladaptatus halobius TaxID=2884875 RepID=UPI001D0A2361|nr:hypothetical protein [Haladaptatus halobius]
MTRRELTGGELDLFADVYVEGFGLPDDIRSGVAANNEVLADRAAWRFFVACVDGVPASVGVLHAKSRIGSLAAAATRPDFRGRGCHMALVRRRMLVAEREGCDLVVGEARFASTSQNNMVR